ncbi:MAG: hypothetical protein NE330_04775 [Lentisphaeraceae bacterium]|nr:hypothetical protein [Lentisphaeraceae bacterium]
MYDLYFADETSMPCSRFKRFRNFNKKDMNVPYGTFSHSFTQEHVLQNQLLPAVQLSEDLVNELERHDITETARLFLRSPHSSLTSRGEAYVIAFDELLVLLWKPDSATIYNLVKLENTEVTDLSGEIEDDNEELIVLRFETEDKVYSMWFPEANADDVVEFINTWKVYIAHLDDENFLEEELQEEAEVELESEEDVHYVPDIREVDQKDLPRTVLFGTLLIDQMADQDNNITSTDLEYLSMVISNTDLLSMCITNFKKHVSEEILTIIKEDFNDAQKLMLVSNMADLAFRDGEPHELELVRINEIIKAIDFASSKLEQLMEVFRVKNDPAVLEGY